MKAIFLTCHLSVVAFVELSDHFIYSLQSLRDHRLFERTKMVSVIKLDLCLLNFVCLIEDHCCATFVSSF